MPQKILIVEDEQSIRQLYEMKLKHHKYDVVTAVDGEEGLEKAETEKPDLILLDLKMPNKSGEEMLEELRATDWGEHIKVIILTNINRSEAPIGLQALQIEQYVLKAMYTPKQVLEIVEKALAS